MGVVYRARYQDRGKVGQSEFYVVRIGHEGRRTTFLREAKALFASDVLKHLDGVQSPFDGIPVSERISTRYRSQVPDLEALVTDACRGLNTDEHRECFKVFLLAALAGLTRSEIDLLEWDAFDFEKRLLRIQVTKHFVGKSESSLRDIPLDPKGRKLSGASRHELAAALLLDRRRLRRQAQAIATTAASAPSTN